MNSLNPEDYIAKSFKIEKTHVDLFTEMLDETAASILWAGSRGFRRLHAPSTQTN